MISIRLRLLRLLILPILLINLAGASLTYVLAWMPAQLAFDQSLAASANALAARLRPGTEHATIDLPRQAEQVLRADALDALYFVTRTPGGKVIAGDTDFPALDPDKSAAYDDVMRGEPVRVAVLTAYVGEQEVRIGVAKTLRSRQQIRSAIVRALILMETLFTLALIGLIWFSVTNGLLPLERMRANLAAREADELAPIESGAMPGELTPVIGAFNELLGKVQSGARAQHAFLADVAHQLRTPLAGVKLQLEWLGERHRDDPATQHSLSLMLMSNERMIRQTNQLLALARAEPGRFQKSRLERLDIAPLVAQVIQYFVDQARKKEIDIGFELDSTVVEGDAFLLRDLIDNLIDNAVRYTPAYGHVTVRCRPATATGGAAFEVEDSGPGIAPERRSQVLQRHVRLDDTSTGTGLGLAIVRDICVAHHATLVLDTPASGAGLLIAVHFPPAPAAGPLPAH